MESRQLLINHIDEHLEVLSSILHNLSGAELCKIANMLLECKGHVYLFGNGGSAADAQHFAAELMVKYKEYREPIPAIALTCDSSVLTAHYNDFNDTCVFERQIDALGHAGDIAIAFTTTHSANVIRALHKASKKEMITVLFGGKDTLSYYIPDYSLCVPSEKTSIVQEMHQVYYHLICELIDGMIK